jgi:histidyl-tRNA synthetase
VDDYMSEEAGAFFTQVTSGLDRAGVKWARDPRLVRGLDYYRHTAFEFVTEDLGAQSAVIAGGRYDGLIESMGGPHTPAVGWAAGIERLAMLIEPPSLPAPDAVLVPLGEAAEAAAIGMLADLRRSGLACEMAYKGNMKKRMQKAAASGARFAVILGGDELSQGEAAVKRLATGEQQSVSLDNLAEALRAQ